MRAKLYLIFSIIVSTIGFIAWFWLNFHSPSNHPVFTLIGIGYGLAWGGAIVSWIRLL